MLSKIKILVSFFILLFIGSGLFSQNNQTINSSKESRRDQVFYFLGNSGTGTTEQLDMVTKGLSRALEKTPGTVLFLGNSIPFNNKQKTKNADIKEASTNIIKQTKLLSINDSKVYYLPGVSEWSFGLNGIQQFQKHLKKGLSRKDAFLPRDGCPIEKLHINKTTDLLLIDSYWAMMNWNSEPGINSGCSIQSKEDFFIEIEDEMIKSQGKTLIIGMHHPLASFGPKGNPRAFGLSFQSLNDSHYRYFRERLGTLARQWSHVIFVAAHDNSLQLQYVDESPMLVSGSASKATRVRKAKKDNEYALSSLGFIRVSVKKNGLVLAEFFASANNFSKPIFKQEIKKPIKQSIQTKAILVDSMMEASIYNHKPLKQNALNEIMFGTNYMKDYMASVKVPAVDLDTLFGGLKAVRKGGGHQTLSLRLEDKSGRQYTMRSLEKSALRFAQYFVYRTHYLNPEYKETYLLRVLQEYWTTANPYGVLPLGDLMDAVNILHPSPYLFYVPKQPALGNFNDKFGDRLYFIEEHLSDGHGDLERLGYSDEIISSFKLLKKLKNRDQVTIDKSLYIRNRLFDNLIGDWDRHADQWRWARHEKADGTEFYRPIPRDRDQAFSDFDGLFLRTLTLLSPPLRFMQKYDEDYNHIRWFNDAGDDLDLAVLDSHSLEDWQREARFIKKQLTDSVISTAFKQFPKEVDATQKAKVKLALQGRLQRIESLAKDLYMNLSRHILITGTEDADNFIITRRSDGLVSVEGRKLGEKHKKPFWQQTYNPKITREIWVYGMEGADQFKVTGSGKGSIFIRLIGGNGKDTYVANDSRALRIYDYRSEPNTIEGSVKSKLSNRHDMNTYHFKNRPRTMEFFSPILSYERDNKLTLGFSYNSTFRSIFRKPFTSQHKFGARYFSGTSGLALDYSGEFAEVFTGVNFGINASYSSPNHVLNFFGMGNYSLNPEDELGIEYNQVRIRRFHLEPKLILNGFRGSKLTFSTAYNYYQVERSSKRFIASGVIPDALFDGNHYIGASGSYYFKNFDNNLQPRLGLGFGVKLGVTINPDTKLGFGYLIPELQITNKLDVNGRWVIATKIKGHLISNNHYAFFQAATLGGFEGLRGFRQQRFTGKSSFYQTTDLRISLGQVNRDVLPTGLTLYGGYDYGRVWYPKDQSTRWHDSYGGGVYINVMGYLAGNIAYFDSADGGRLVIGLSVPF